MPALIMGAVPMSQTSAANSFNTLMRSLGTSLASAIVGVILAQMTMSSGGFDVPTADAFKVTMLVAAGASILDVGGESTRPGAGPVATGEELRRVLPVVEGLAGGSALLSVDTSKAAVAEVALRAGATIVNDVTALGDPDMAAVCAAGRATVVLMHMRGGPATMQADPRYDDVVDDVKAFLESRVQVAVDAGIGEDRIWVDPGIGFGKRAEHNLALLGRLKEICERLAVPVMVGVSRKAFIGQLTGRIAAERQFGTAAAVTACVLAGARAVRVHDVPQMREVVKVANAIRDAGA
jgi:dihydropteroate synthase